MARKTRKPKQVTALTHGEASRKNLPTEHQAVLAEDDRAGAGDLRAAQSRRQADHEVLDDKPYEDKRASAWLARSPSRACRRIARYPWTKTTSRGIRGTRRTRFVTSGQRQSGFHDGHLESLQAAGTWATLHSNTSRPFPKPKSGRIAVKVINHLGDEVMKVVRLPGETR